MPWRVDIWPFSFTGLLASILVCGLAGCPRPAGDDVSPPAKSRTGDRSPDDAEASRAGNADSTPARGKTDAGNQGGNSAHKYTNRLAKQTSPYLLLHAHNPVDWYPWGEEAFKKAQADGKPIFLSLGYSSCYWCHVMERESFMDEEIAKFLNEHFICIKVDREERPDVDQIYMTALQLTGQRGGWPLSIFLSPDGKPLFSRRHGMLGGTYWPPRDGERGTGFLTVIQTVEKVWTEDQQSLLDGADQVAQAVQEELRGQRAAEEIELDHKMIDAVWDDLQDEYDPTWGGFGYVAANPQAPKFPQPSYLMFLIDRVRRKDVENWQDAHEMLTHTLDKMAQGGIYDHLGGGFHRYSTDRFWRIPHFEKMLYDNGQLASVYAEAYKLTGNEEYRYVVEGILEFVQREMTDDDGGFYAALDAESEGEEGKFYRWTKEELDKLLGERDRALFGEIYNLNGEPNFNDEHSGGEYYVPMLSKSLAEHAQQRGMTLDELREKLEPTRRRLFEVRKLRKRPLTDTKILTSWNGLMIRGFADAGRLLDEPHYVDVAENAAYFVLNKLRDDDGRLLRTYTAGEAKLHAYLDDYAFYIDGLIAIQRAGGPLTSKAEMFAHMLTDKQIELFWDEDGGGFFFTSDDHEALIARAKSPIDSAIPAGNSVSAGNLLYLAEKLDGDNAKSYREKARQTMLSAGVYLRAQPGAVPRLAVHVAEYLNAAGEPPEANAPRDGEGAALAEPVAPQR